MFQNNNVQTSAFLSCRIQVTKIVVNDYSFKFFKIVKTANYNYSLKVKTIIVGNYDFENCLKV